MPLQGELERYVDWSSEFKMKEDGPHTFRLLEKVREIETIVWRASDDKDKIVDITAVISR